ncbi:MAG: hypothetical protein DCC52_16070 [Chloroflexi bacterium]|nr:MAG: hypothetical protein DCC52_16070 [Chloroflexota bacterium]
MKLIAGLGNPGIKYARNRHNVGFMTLDHLARAEHKRFERQRFNAQLLEVNLADERVLLVKPQTYMNLSGSAVGKLAAFYRLARADVMIVYDDLDLPLGKIRLRAKHRTPRPKSRYWACAGQFSRRRNERVGRRFGARRERAARVGARRHHQSDERV